MTEINLLLYPPMRDARVPWYVKALVVLMLALEILINVKGLTTI